MVQNNPFQGPIGQIGILLYLNGIIFRGMISRVLLLREIWIVNYYFINILFFYSIITSNVHQIISVAKTKTLVFPEK